MKPYRTAVLSVLLTFGAGSANAAVLTATASTIVAVFAKAKGGDTIKLSGTFGRTTLAGRSFSTALKIDASRAVFTDTWLIKDISGLYITGGKYGSTTAATGYNKAIAVYGGDNVTVTRASFVGAKLGTGIGFVKTTNATISNSTFTSLKSGVGFTSVTGGTIINNKSIRAASDGFDIADSHSVMVTKNSCSNTSPGPMAHPDCVQLWSVAGNAPQSDITVTGNTATGATQGFTSFDESAGGGLRISISNNRVNTSYSQGIACYGCVDSVFTGNVVTTLAGSAHKTNINIIHGMNNVVADNKIGPRVTAPPPAKAAPAMTPAASAFLAYSGKAVGSDLASDSFDHSVMDDTWPGDVVSSSEIVADSAAVAGVPEPSSWLMMIAGFGLVGSALRNRSRISTVGA